MNHALQLRLAPVDGSAVRALWLTERQGFRLEKVNMKPGSDCLSLHVEVSGRGQPVSPLVDALNALDDVDTINCQPVAVSSEAVAV
ncbi:MAG: hypothetical protein AAGA23_10205 [Pseudomonadota bacterium]